MSVLFSELLVPGWADSGEKMGLKDVTGTYDDPRAFTLPCHNAEPETFFSEAEADIKAAKALCGECPMRSHLAEQGIVMESVAVSESRYLPPLIAVWKIHGLNKTVVWAISGDVPVSKKLMSSLAMYPAMRCEVLTGISRGVWALRYKSIAEDVGN